MVAIRHRSISMHFSVTEKLNCHLLEQRHLSPNWFGYWLALYNLHPWHYHLRSPFFYSSSLLVNCRLRPSWAVCEKSVSGDPRNGHWTCQWPSGDGCALCLTYHNHTFCCLRRSREDINETPNDGHWLTADALCKLLFWVRFIAANGVSLPNCRNCLPSLYCCCCLQLR